MVLLDHKVIMPPFYLPFCSYAVARMALAVFYSVPLASETKRKK